MQALCVCTLGSEADAQRIDGIRTADTSMDDDGAAADTAAPGGTVYERFYLQYFFPPSSVGECGRVGPVGQFVKCSLKCSSSVQPVWLCELSDSCQQVGKLSPANLHDWCFAF